MSRPTCLFAIVIQNTIQLSSKSTRIMGQKVPIPDDKMQKQIDLLKMEKKDLGKLWASFKRYDKDKSGAIDVDEFYKIPQEELKIIPQGFFCSILSTRKMYAYICRAKKTNF